MAEQGFENNNKDVTPGVEATDRGLFDFGKKKNTEEEAISHEFDQKVQVSHDHHQPGAEHEEEKKHGGGLLEKLHRTSSSSSSSSEEEVEVEEGGLMKKIRKKKEKKGKKVKEETNIPIEKGDDAAATGEEKKGFLDKIKEKLPGGQKKTSDHREEVAPAPAVHHDHDGADKAAAGKEEKKGFLEKIKEKLPGYHPKSDDEKEKVKETASH